MEYRDLALVILLTGVMWIPCMLAMSLVGGLGTVVDNRDMALVQP